MNAFNKVNLAAAVMFTTAEHAAQLGIPETRLIYPLGGAGTTDKQDCEWPTLTRSYPE
jgi:P pilus assembly chaperone PapD